MLAFFKSIKTTIVHFLGSKVVVMFSVSSNKAIDVDILVLNPNNIMHTTPY